MQGKEPLKVASSLNQLLQTVREAVGAVEPSRYRSWSEKLAGKSFGGHGVRHHAEALVLIRRSLGDPNDADFFARVQTLEVLRAALTPLDDGALVAVGVAEWRVSNPEIHRAAALQQHKARIDATCSTLGVSIDQVDGGHELLVTGESPVLAFVRLNLATKFSSAA
tara:strand:- start:97 stop:594 length:498 start_codon:yes stop_codon:yes gene_type:complete